MVFTKGVKPSCSQTLLQFPRACDHARERHVWRRIEIEDDAFGRFRIAGLAAPGMQFRHALLRQRDEPLGAVDAEIRLRFALDLDGQHRHRRALEFVALEELLAVDPVRRAHDGDRAVLHMRQHALRRSRHVAREIELGDGRPELRLRPQFLVGMADGDTQHGVVVLCGLVLRGHGFLLRRIGGNFRHHGVRRLVEPQSLERRLPEQAIRRHILEFDFRHQLRLDPVHIRQPRRRVRERRRGALERLQPPKQIGRDLAAITRSRPAPYRRAFRSGTCPPAASGICSAFRARRRSRLPDRRGISISSSCRRGRRHRARPAALR